MVQLDSPAPPRKSIIPWYDSETLCLVTLVLMVFVFIFGYIGWTVTRISSTYSNYLWLPFVLMTASGIVICSMTIRLIKRYFGRRAK